MYLPVRARGTCGMHGVRTRVSLRVRGRGRSTTWPPGVLGSPSRPSPLPTALPGVTPGSLPVGDGGHHVGRGSCLRCQRPRTGSQSGPSVSRGHNHASAHLVQPLGQVFCPHPLPGACCGGSSPPVTSRGWPRWRHLWARKVGCSRWDPGKRRRKLQLLEAWLSGTWLSVAGAVEPT